MKSDIPKVLHFLQGKPLIQHVVDSLKDSGVRDIVVVVGYKGNEVIDAVEGGVDFAWQHEQLGTGHAVLQAEESLKGFQGRVIIACGDVPLIRQETFQHIADKALEVDTRAVVLTMTLENPFGYGRIIKDESGNFLRIVEEKDATDEEKCIGEVNTGTYVIDRELLFEALGCIGNDNAQNEYYLPDVLSYIISKGYMVATSMLDNPIEGSGINSKEDLDRVLEYLDQK